MLKMGEYFRTKLGYIGRIQSSYLKKKNNKFPNWTICQVGSNRFIVFCNDDNDEILCHSMKLSDIVFAGDFLNGYRVFERINDRILIYKNTKKRIKYWTTIKDDIIVEILTKEMYEKVKYKKESIDIWEQN